VPLKPTATLPLAPLTPPPPLTPAAYITPAAHTTHAGPTASAAPAAAATIAMAGGTEGRAGGACIGTQIRQTTILSAPTVTMAARSKRGSTGAGSGKTGVQLAK
jgi:hypothetical protein